MNFETDFFSPFFMPYPTHCSIDISFIDRCLSAQHLSHASALSLLTFPFLNMSWFVADPVPKIIQACNTPTLSQRVDAKVSCPLRLCVVFKAVTRIPDGCVSIIMVPYGALYIALFIFFQSSDFSDTTNWPTLSEVVEVRTPFRTHFDRLSVRLIVL